MQMIVGDDKTGHGKVYRHLGCQFRSRSDCLCVLVLILAKLFDRFFLAFEVILENVLNRRSKDSFDVHWHVKNETRDDYKN